MIENQILERKNRDFEQNACGNSQHDEETKDNGEEELSDYEKRRLQRIQENHQLMKSLGLMEAQP